MHLDRSNGSWPELKGKRHNQFDDKPLESLDVKHGQPHEDINDIQKVKKHTKLRLRAKDELSDE